VAYIWLTLFKYAFICIPNTGRHIRIWYSKSTISYTICIIRNISNYGGTCQINSISMIFSFILNLPIKRPSVQKTLHFSAIRLVCSFRPTNRQYMAIYAVIMVAHARFKGIWEPLLIYFKLWSHVMSEICSFFGKKKNEKAAGNLEYQILIWRPVFGIQIKAYLNNNQI
jgi:hypothetical protein